MPKTMEKQIFRYVCGQRGSRKIKGLIYLANRILSAFNYSYL